MQLTNSCSKSFIEVDPKGETNEADYYQNQAEAFAALTAVYDVVGWQGNGFVTKVNALDAASDDHFAGGGGPNDVTNIQVFSSYSLSPAVGPQEEMWRMGFSGVFRANVLMAKIPGVPMDDALKARYIAEAKLLRAYYYFDLLRFFKNIPLILEPLNLENMYNVPQATPQEVWAQIEKDLTEALAEANLPDVVPAASEGGRVTKGIGHALLGKVYLYQQKWAQAAAEFREVNGPTPGQPAPKYGYNLLANFGDLWKSDRASKFNSESIFEVSHSSTSAGNWDCVSCTEGNVLGVMVGPRAYTPKTPDAPDYISGWSFLVVTPSLYNAMHGDPRFKYTIADLDSLERNGIATYQKANMNTGYFLEKFAGRTSTRSDAGGNWELNFGQNMYEIRLADTYLMEAEALVHTGESGGAGTRSYQLLNAVRARVGLPAITATLDNIFNERRLELAGEGHRWFDLVRSGRAATVLASRGFVAGRHEILPIPLLEMENTLIEQSKEWGGTK